MPRIFLKDQILDVETDDFIEFNKILKQHEDEMLAFSIEVYGRKVTVFLESGIIEVDDKKYCESNTLKPKRWISFRRREFKMSMNGEIKDEKVACFGFGWQYSGEKNIKKVVLINPDGSIDG